MRHELPRYTRGNYWMTRLSNYCQQFVVPRCSSLIPAGSVEATSLASIKEVVLGFHPALSWRSIECMSHRFGKSVGFRKAPLANSIGSFMPKVCWIGWYLVLCTRVFIWPFGSRGSATKLCWLLPSYGTTSRSMVKSPSEECHGSRICGVAMVVRVFVSMWNWLDD
jgi:hypothetical protein